VTGVVLDLTADDAAMLDGSRGPALGFAMRIITRTAAVMGADQLLSISGAHIDSCLFHGQAGLDFAARLVSDGAAVRVPTTLNVASLDLLHPNLFRGSQEAAKSARQLMQHYQSMGCKPTWTCAPYQEGVRPGIGQHVAWAESNAVVFANSVLGARTHRYGDFIDICAAITGRAPAAGLHLDQNRYGNLVFDLAGLDDAVLANEMLPSVLGLYIGARSGSHVPVVVGMPEMGEDQLKELGATAASSGSVGMFHVVGSTPEAPTLAQATGGTRSPEVVLVELADLRQAWGLLSTVSHHKLGAVSLGAPHYSVSQFAKLLALLDQRRINRNVSFYVNTSRAVVAELELRGWLNQIEKAGIQLVTDTCTYITPVMAPFDGAVMTDSAKWAYYAPSNLGVDVVLAATEDCVTSARAGRIVRGETPW